KQDATHKLLRFALRHLWRSSSRLRIFFAAARVFRDLGLARLLLKSRLPGLVSERAEFALALLDNSRASLPLKNAGPENGEHLKSTVLLFQGCVGEGLFARVNKATRRVL